MEKINTFLLRLLVSEIGAIFFLLIYIAILMKNNKIGIIFIIFFFILIFISIINLILALLFHAMDISKKSSIITFVITITIIIILYKKSL
ncbi:hypothetical protein BXU01_18380 [[Flexibacter] sp. ATCC 35103]|nr:hypothetical protein BXU01_18125 [[Flexibacter] sp. ATCC 35103]OMQ09328.1 hypothetical protein BXU01_18380 [[Flexibacter] sp. ATCC 35103]